MFIYKGFCCGRNEQRIKVNSILILSCISDLKLDQDHYLKTLNKMNCLKYLTSVRKTSNNLSDVHFHGLLHRKYPICLFIYLVCFPHNDHFQLYKYFIIL